MCGRFTLKTPSASLAEHFLLPGIPQLSARFNIAPTQLVLCIRSVSPDSVTREAATLRWGLIPSWAKDPSVGARMINARSETAAEKPAFRHAYKSQRCIIPADGFYEWQKTAARTKQPWYIHREDAQVIGFAGLWDSWSSKESDESIQSCTILTTQANDDLRELHERMPVILPEENYDAWLSLAASPGQLQSLMQPMQDGILTCYPVDKLVNKVANDVPECMQQVAVHFVDEPPEKPRDRQRTLFD